MNTSISENLYFDIQGHLESAYPYEACGFLLGTDKDKERLIHTSIAVENKSPDNLRKRFVIDPLDYLKAERQALKQGLSLLGIYHSHPDHPAIPSLHDLEYAQPCFSYFIFSIEKGKLSHTRSYRLMNGKFLEEKINIHCPEPLENRNRKSTGRTSHLLPVTGNIKL